MVHGKVRLTILHHWAADFGWHENVEHDSFLRGLRVTTGTSKVNKAKVHKEDNYRKENKEYKLSASGQGG
jgi:hypothetical protein